jgi:hypothetical protein
MSAPDWTDWSLSRAEAHTGRFLRMDELPGRPRLRLTYSARMRPVGIRGETRLPSAASLALLGGNSGSLSRIREGRGIPNNDEVNALRQRRYDRSVTDSARAHTFALRADLEGFLTRECPACSRHFKLRVLDWFGGIPPEPPRLNDRSSSDGTTGHCPLCYELVVHGNWRTNAQQQFIRNVIADAASLDYSNRLLSASMGSRAVVELAGFPLGAISEALEEEKSMSLVILPCHEDCSLQIPSDWTKDVSCFLCGTRYPLTKV